MSNGAVINDDASKRECLLTAWCQSCQDEYWNYSEGEDHE